MKKVLNISTVQQALRRLPVAFLIAGSGFLPNASAVRYTIDFQGKAVDLQKCECFFNLLGKYAWYSPKNYWSSFDSENCKLSIDNKKKDDSYDIVFANGSITKDVSEKFSQNICVESLNSFTFENFKGELNLNPGLQSCTKTIRLENCEFTITENCFRYTKNFEPCNSDLVLENGLFHIPENMGDWCGNAYIVLPKGAKLANNTTLGSPLSIPFNVAVDVLQRRQCSLGYYYGYIKIEELSLIRTENEKLRKELKSVREKHEEEIKKFQGDLDRERAKRISSGDNLRKDIKSAQEAHKKTKKELEEKNLKMATLLGELSVAQEEFKTAKDEKEGCEKANAALKEKIRNFRITCKSLETNKERLDSEIEKLRALNSELKEANKTLEAENNALKEKIRKSSETVELADKMVKKHADLKKEIKQLKDNSEEKGDELNKILQQVKTKDKEISKWKKMYETMLGWVKYAHHLITVDLKKSVPGTTNILHKKGYGAEIEKLKSAIEKIKNGDFKKKDKKGQWIDFDETFGQNDDNEQEEDKEDESVWRSETTYRGRGQQSRGRGGYFRGNYRGRRGGGQPMKNRGRGGY